MSEVPLWLARPLPPRMPRHPCLDRKSSFEEARGSCLNILPARTCLSCWITHTDRCMLDADCRGLWRMVNAAGPT